jgi:pimeloyl-ACP methyl ester carboxylesterase
MALALFAEHVRPALRHLNVDLSAQQQALAAPATAYRVKDTAATNTLIVWGREDRIVPWQHGEVLAAAIPHSKFAVIADAGHTPMREKRETCQRIVRDFLIGQGEELERDSMVKG